MSTSRFIPIQILGHIPSLKGSAKAHMLSSKSFLSFPSRPWMCHCLLGILIRPPVADGSCISVTGGFQQSFSGSAHIPGGPRHTSDGRGCTNTLALCLSGATTLRCVPHRVLTLAHGGKFQGPVTQLTEQHTSVDCLPIPG